MSVEMIIGIGMMAVSFIVKHVYQEFDWFVLNFIASIIFLVLGFLLWSSSKKRKILKWEKYLFG